MRNRIDKLGVAEPEIRKQGSDQIVIQLAGVHDPASAAKLIGKTAVLEFYDFEADLTGPSVTSGLQKVPVATGTLYELLSSPETRALADRGASQWYLFDANKRVVAGPVPSKDLLPTLAEAEKKQKRQIKGPLETLRVPQNTVVVSCDYASDPANCISSQQITTNKVFYLLKHRLPDASGDNGIPEMTGNELKLSGTRADIDPQSNAPVVLMQFTGKGKKVFHEITRREAQRGSLACQGASSQQDIQRCAQHFAIVLDRQIESVPYIDFKQNPDGIPGDNGAQIDLGGGSLGDAKKLALVLQTGALPVDLHDRGAHGRVRHARQGLAEPGQEGGDRRPARRRALPAAALPLPRARRGDRPRHLCSVPVRGDPPLQRHADPAGLRGTDPHDRGGRRRERRCVRAHQGRSARWEVRACGDRGGLLEGLPHDHRRQRRHGYHSAGAVRGRDRAGQGLRADAADRNRDLARHGGRATRAMLGLLGGFRWFSNPRFMGAQGQQTAKWLQIDFMRKRYLWFGDLARWSSSSALCRSAFAG